MIARSSSHSALLFGMALATLGLAGCASTVSSGDPAPAAAPQPTSNARELVRLRTRSGDVAVLVGSGGRVVTVYDTAGVALLRQVEIGTLRTTDPALYEMLTTSVATRAPYLDATGEAPTRAAAPGASVDRSR